MGWNTTVVVMNDALSYIENDPEFGKKLTAAIRRLGVPDGARSRDVFAQIPGGRVHVNAATVIETHNANEVVTVDVGGNTAVVVTTRYDSKFPSDSDRSTHKCFACGRPHAGLDFENKYCTTCGDAAQERRTYREALQRIRIGVEKDGGGALPQILVTALEALVVGPKGERLDVGAAEKELKDYLSEEE